MDANASLPIPLNEETLNIDLHRSMSPVVIVDAATRRLAESPARAKAASEQRRGTPQPESPPSVTRGAKSSDVPPACPPPGVYTGVDWFRAVGPESLVPSLIAWCVDRFGAGAPVRSRMYYEGGFEFESGAVLLTGHSSETCLIEISGSALASLDGDERIELMRELVIDFGMTARRLDIARDYVGQDLGIYHAALASCRAKELCGGITYSVWEKGNIETDDDPGRTLYLGQRGKAGSGRMVRVYDKGKEQKIAGIQAGYWERWEAEFSKDAAHVAALVVMGEFEELDRWKAAKEERHAVVRGYLAESFDGADWLQRAASVALSAMDFREVVYANNKDGEPVRVRELSRRARVPWFQRLVEGMTTVRVKASRRFPQLARWARWMGTAALPTVMAMVESTKGALTLEAMFRTVLGGDLTVAKPGKRSVLWEFINAINPDGTLKRELWQLPTNWTPPKLRRA